MGPAGWRRAPRRLTACAALAALPAARRGAAAAGSDVCDDDGEHHEVPCSSCSTGMCCHECRYPCAAISTTPPTATTDAPTPTAGTPASAASTTAGPAAAPAGAGAPRPAATAPCTAGAGAATSTSAPTATQRGGAPLTTAPSKAARTTPVRTMPTDPPTDSNADLAPEEEDDPPARGDSRAGQPTRPPTGSPWAATTTVSPTAVTSTTRGPIAMPCTAAPTAASAVGGATSMPTATSNSEAGSLLDTAPADESADTPAPTAALPSSPDCIDNMRIVSIEEEPECGRAVGVQTQCGTRCVPCEPSLTPAQATQRLRRAVGALLAACEVLSLVVPRSGCGGACARSAVDGAGLPDGGCYWHGDGGGRLRCAVALAGDVDQAPYTDVDVFKADFVSDVAILLRIGERRIPLRRISLRAGSVIVEFDVSDPAGVTDADDATPAWLIGVLAAVGALCASLCGGALLLRRRRRYGTAPKKDFWPGFANDCALLDQWDREHGSAPTKALVNALGPQRPAAPDKVASSVLSLPDPGAAPKIEE